MGGMDKYIHIKSDRELKAALSDSAKRHMRKETDEARYLLMKALGLLAEEETPPYQTRAQELIKRQLARHESPYLYPSQNDTPIDYSNWRKKAWATACKAAGIKDAKWNDWRHTFASDLTMAGHSDRTVADLMGHRSTQMVKRYAHLSNRHLRAAIEGLAMPSNQRPTAARPGRKKTR